LKHQIMLPRNEKITKGLSSKKKGECRGTIYRKKSCPSFLGTANSYGVARKGRGWWGGGAEVNHLPPKSIFQRVNRREKKRKRTRCLGEPTSKRPCSYRKPFSGEGRKKKSPIRGMGVLNRGDQTNTDQKGAVGRKRLKERAKEKRQFPGRKCA